MLLLSVLIKILEDRDTRIDFQDVGRSVNTDSGLDPHSDPDPDKGRLPDINWQTSEDFWGFLIVLRIVILFTLVVMAFRQSCSERKSWSELTLIVAFSEFFLLYRLGYVFSGLM